LLNILCGIDDPSAGIVTVSGKLLYGISDDERTGLRAKHMGFIFQQFNLLPVLTALENVELPLLVGKVDAAKARIKARKALDSVGLGDRYDHRPAELSGGQQQRVAVARAFVHSPDVILCDEPTGNLDSRTSTEIMDLLMALNRDEGVTLVIVTHDEEIAARCHRILHMSDGMMVTEEG
jgi:putative ABC transport system ATP-binding protein